MATQRRGPNNLNKPLRVPSPPAGEREGAPPPRLRDTGNDRDRDRVVRVAVSLAVAVLLLVAGSAWWILASKTSHSAGRGAGRVPTRGGHGGGGARVAWGFLPEYRLDAADGERLRAMVSHVVLFSVEVDGARGGVREAERVRGWPRRLGLSGAMVAVGGAGRSAGFAAALRDPARRRRTVEELVELVRAEALVGVEVNWQFPTSMEDLGALKAFVQELKRAARAVALPRDLVVTTAIPPTASYARALAESGVAGVVDVMHVMLYLDGVGRPSALRDADRVLRELGSVVPMRKLSLGVPFYGVSQSGGGETKTYEEILSMPPPERARWHFEGRDTLAGKLQLVDALGLAGVSVWELGSDCRARPVGRHPRTCPDDADSLLDVVGAWRLSSS